MKTAFLLLLLAAGCVATDLAKNIPAPVAKPPVVVSAYPDAPLPAPLASIQSTNAVQRLAKASLATMATQLPQTNQSAPIAILTKEQVKWLLFHPNGDINARIRMHGLYLESSTNYQARVEYQILRSNPWECLYAYGTNYCK